MTLNADEFKESNKKAAKHSRTKSQLQMLSKQMCDRANIFVGEIEDAGIGEFFPPVSAIVMKGRRKMDQENLDKQMIEEDEKAGGLRRKILTSEDAANMADSTQLTNYVKYVADRAVILQHERIPKVLIEKWWDAPAGAGMDEKFAIADETFVHWPHSNIDPKKIKTKGAKLKLIKEHIKWVKATSKKMKGWVEDLGGFHKSVHNSDFMAFFVQPVPRAFGEDIVMEPEEETLISYCTTSDSHYSYHKK